MPIFAQAAGAKLAYIAEEAASPAAQAIVVPQSSTIKTIAELKGKKIAVTKGAGSHYLLLAALAKSGLNFKDITPAYLTPADGRAAFVSNNVDAWVAWDPFLTSALHQTKGSILTDGSNGLASYKRYYLASAAYADKHAEVLDVIFAKLSVTGKWVKAQPKDAATLLAGLWGIDAATVEEANSHRSYQVGAVTGPGLSEQQRIADAFHAEGYPAGELKHGPIALVEQGVPVRGGRDGVPCVSEDALEHPGGWSPTALRPSSPQRKATPRSNARRARAFRAAHAGVARAGGRDPTAAAARVPHREAPRVRRRPTAELAKSVTVE